MPEYKLTVHSAARDRAVVQLDITIAGRRIRREVTAAKVVTDGRLDADKLGQWAVDQVRDMPDADDLAGFREALITTRQPAAVRTTSADPFDAGEAVRETVAGVEVIE